MRNSLGVRLFLSYIFVVMVAMVVLVVVTQFALPQAYGRHLGLAETATPVAPGSGRGLGQGIGSGMVSGEGGGLFENFRSSFNEALIWAGAAAVLAGLTISLVISRKLAAPIHAMTVASQRISQGHYTERVLEKGQDEIGRLALSFNAMAEKLEQTEAIRRQLIGDVSHELRTPLTIIQGSMEGVMDGVLPANDETFLQIHQEAGRLSRLVDDLQELSRVESDGLELNKRAVNVRDVVEFITKRFSRVYQEKSVNLLVELPDDLPPVLADEDRLQQTLMNLVNNALQYTPAGGSVSITASADGTDMRIAVHDDGIGIPADHLEHIFDRFYRVDKSRSRGSGGGSGIGLTIVKRLVEAHGGRVWAESQGEGSGTTFIFTIPLA